MHASTFPRPKPRALSACLRHGNPPPDDPYEPPDDAAEDWEPDEEDAEEPADWEEGDDDEPEPEPGDFWYEPRWDDD